MSAVTIAAASGTLLACVNRFGVHALPIGREFALVTLPAIRLAHCGARPAVGGVFGWTRCVAIRAVERGVSGAAQLLGNLVGFARGCWGGASRYGFSHELLPRLAPATTHREQERAYYY